jgi:NitT/TauT family transport system permease protein
MKKHYWILSLIVFILLLVVWQIFAISPQFSFFFASPALVASSIWTNILNGILLYATFITGVEAICGFIIGIILGTLIGFLLWYSSAAAHIAKPFVIILGAIPAFAFAPVIILWFGIGITMKIALAAFGVFLVALTQAYEGAKSVDHEEYKLMKLYGASRWQILQKIVFPSSLDWVLTSMKLNIGFAILGAFIGEFISANIGLGHFMLVAGSLYDIPSVFAGGFFLVLLSLILNWGVSYIEKKKIKIIEVFS